jgi:hypothetical protein
MTDPPPEGTTRATSYAFAELLKLAADISAELKEAGPRCQIPVVLSVMAVEAFLNDVSHLAPSAGGSHEGAQTLAAIAKHVPSRIRPRLLLSYYLLTGESLRTDTDPYQSLSVLVELRNAFVHAHPEEWLIDSTSKRRSAEATVAGFIQHLAQKRIAPNATTVRALMIPPVARWAVRTAAGMMDHTIGRIGQSIPTLAWVAATLLVSQIQRSDNPQNNEVPPAS